IRLTQGEARFQVAKDHSRPFIVDAGDARVRAVGTAFDVKVSRERVAVTLVEGVVEVTPIIQPASMRTPSVLTAGQVLSIEHGSGKQLIESVAVERASAWLGRQLVFDSTPLVDAVTEANRYLPQPIVIEDLSLMRMAVSGVIRAGNVDNFIAALESSFPVKAIKRADGQVALVKRTDERARRRAD
ncbi:FecR family protein, partial [Steroidobacter sp.]|uniref:FecR family protein n=1 Tax=Steroidobacter sp. TaxID=1978227 RepID=UPI001A635B02